jgi:site-specific DNA-methyltransferase (adenine-specific)
VNSDLMFSSATDQWPTPQAFFDLWAARFAFDTDVCADADNAKCSRFFSVEDDGLEQSWAPAVCWMNPPYGREIGKWVRKACEESLKGATVVCLLPARTDTAWWHDYVIPHAEVTFVRGRIKFGGAKSGAPFPSAVAVFRPEVTP